LYKAGALMLVTEELYIKKTDLLELHEVRWDGGKNERTEEYIFFYRKRNENHEFRTGFLVRKTLI
jgi:hypothetical protein